MDRRLFLKTGVAAAATLAFGRAAFARDTPRKIVIIGGGLAGLTSAYELKKLGHKVTVLEAQERIGGRVLTLRDFADGQWADAGAARIPEDHDLTHRYVREFALELMPFYPTTGRFSRIKNGKAEPTDWRGFADATSAMMNLEKPAHWQKIKGGNDLLPRAFADRLKDEIRYSSPAARVERQNNGAVVTFTEKGKTQTIKGDLVICAVPFTMLRNIDFSPPLSDPKMRIIERSTYDSASRLFIQTKERFWEKQGLNGFGFGQRQDEIWDASFGESGKHGILESYSRYDYSRELTAQEGAGRIESALRSLEKLFPGVRNDQLKGLSKCWSEDPWVKGAWAHLGAVEMATLVKAEGPLHFAAEHLSFQPSWMQGAIQSALFVVSQISKLPAG